MKVGREVKEYNGIDVMRRGMWWGEWKRDRGTPRDKVEQQKKRWI